MLIANFEKLVEEQNSILELALKQGIMESDGFGSPTARPSSTLTLNSVPMSAYKVRNNLRCSHFSSSCSILFSCLWIRSHISKTMYVFETDFWGVGLSYHVTSDGLSTSKS